MTPQEFFDFTVNAIRAQGEPSGRTSTITGKFICQYRDGAGRKCAAGFHIPDAVYLPEMEGRGVYTMLQAFDDVEGLHGLREHEDLAMALQNAHDGAAKNEPCNTFLLDFDQRARHVASVFGLAYTPPGRMSHEPGTGFIFNYPKDFVSLPEYTAHAGQLVIIVRELTDGVEYDNPKSVNPDNSEEGSDRMFTVRAADGWEGCAWESELDPVTEAL